MKFKEFKEYISFENIVTFILLVIILISLLAVIIFIPIEIITSIGHHQCITFEDGTEFHVDGAVIYEEENIIFENRDSKISIPIKDRSYTVTDCDCENAVSNIEDIREIYNE